MKNLTLKKLAKIIGILLFIVVLILTIFSFIIISVYQDFIILGVLMGVYSFACLLLISNCILIGDYFHYVESFIEEHLPLSFFTKYDLKFDILENSKMVINVSSIEIDNKYQYFRESTNLITDVLYFLDAAKTIKICGFTKSKKVKVTIDKQILIKFLKTIPENRHFNTLDLSQFEVPVIRMDVYSPFLDCILTFLNLNNDLNFFTRIQQISRKQIIEWMIQNEKSLIIDINSNDYIVKTGSLKSIGCNGCQPFELRRSRNYNWMDFRYIFYTSVLNTMENVKTKNNENELKLDSLSDNMEVGQSYLFSEKYSQNENSSKIIELMNEIDKKLKAGFEFNSIKSERWNTVYKSEIEEILNSKYSLTDEMENRILKILISLKDDMFDNQEKQDTIRKDTSISALENMLKMDGVENQNNFKF